MRKRKINDLIYNLDEDKIYSKKYQLRELCIKYKVSHMYPELILILDSDDDYITESEEDDDMEFELISDEESNEEPPFKILKDGNGFVSMSFDE